MLTPRSGVYLSIWSNHMAFPEDMVLTRIEFGAGPDEIQNTGFWSRVQGASGVDFNWSDFVNDAAAKVRDAWMAQMGPGNYSPYIVAQRVVCYHYDQPHNTVLDRGEAAFASGDWKGTGNTALPPQDTMVLSLYGYDPATFVPLRQYKRGRMYLPTPAGGNTNIDTATGTYSNQAALLAECAGWWGALQGAISTGVGSANLQPVISSSHGGGLATDAQWLRMGRVVDTQRRRRNALDEQYVTVNVP
jgi:hypothetical protein